LSIENNDFLKDWLEGKISAEEIKKRKSSGDAFIQDYDELITQTSNLQVPTPISKEDAWEKLAGQLTGVPKKETKVITMTPWIALSVAASLTLLIISFFYLNTTTIATQLAETKEHVLPDGSVVVLNAGSEITYRQWNFKNSRKITLQGEAFFNVKKGQTFSVESEHGVVTVLGTSFNIKSRNSGYRVYCYSGKVKVEKGSSEVYLTKGLFTGVENNTLKNPTVFNDKQTTWRTGDFYFEATPLREVIDELERQFNIEISFNGDDSRLYTGYFNKNDRNEALTMVFKPMLLTFQEQQPNKFVVR